MKSIRLMAIIFVSFAGVIFENATDAGAKVIFFSVISTIFFFKLQYEMMGINNLQERYPLTYMQKIPLNFLGLIYSCELTFMVLSFVIIAKWTSRKWFPIFAIITYLG
jgi:hypothetical protein